MSKLEQEDKISWQSTLNWNFCSSYDAKQTYLNSSGSSKTAPQHQPCKGINNLFRSFYVNLLQNKCVGGNAEIVVFNTIVHKHDLTRSNCWVKVNQHYWFVCKWAIMPGIKAKFHVTVHTISYSCERCKYVIEADQLIQTINSQYNEWQGEWFNRNGLDKARIHIVSHIDLKDPEKKSRTILCSALFEKKEHQSSMK